MTGGSDPVPAARVSPRRRVRRRRRGLRGATIANLAFLTIGMLRDEYEAVFG